MNRSIRPFLLIPLLCLCPGSHGQDLLPTTVFGTNGATNTDIGTGADIVIRHALQPDGKLLLGTYLSGTGLHIGLMRIDTACGALDASFGTGGKSVHIFELKSTLLDLTVLPDGRILCSGVNSSSSSTSSSVGSIYRFNSDGTPDLTFNGTGWRADRFDANSGGANAAVVLAPTGGYYTVGVSTFNNSGGVNGFGVMRYLEDGTLDNTFSADGKAWLPPPAPFFYIRCETGLLLADGSVLNIGGVGNDIDPYQICLTKFLPSGEPDLTFGTGGQIVTSVAYSEANLQRRISAVLLPDGRFLLGVRSVDQRAMVACFMPDGSLDLDYGTDGISEMDPTTGNDIANGLQLLPDGGTVQFGSSGSGSGHYMVKRNAEGQPEALFGSNGVVLIPDITGDQYIGGGVMLNDHSAIVYGADGFPTEVALAIKMTEDPNVGRFADLGPDAGLCPGSSITLDAGVPGSSYLWNNNSTAPTLEVSVGGTYHVAITNTAGCTDRDTVEISAFTAPPVPTIESDGAGLVTDASSQIQWLLDGEAIPDATDPSYTPIENGVYTVSDTGENGCGSLSLPFTLLNVGIPGTGASNMDLHVNPNPVVGQATLNFVLGESMAVTLELRDALGRLITTFLNRQVLRAGEQRFALSLPNDLAAGSYLLVLSHVKGRTSVRISK